MRLEKNVEIRRVIRGVYEKPQYSQLLHEYAAPEPVEIARAISRNYNWTIVPAGDTALNLLGLSTQVSYSTAIRRINKIRLRGMKMKKNKSRVLVICGVFIANCICACSSINASSHIQESVSNIERDIATTNEDSTTGMKKKTNESLKVYLDLLGADTEDGNVNVSDQFLDNLSNVYIMGRTGTVTHAMSIESDTQIGIMEWNDNEAATEKEFEKFRVNHF